MQSDQLGLFTKTSPESSTPPTTRLGASSLAFLGQMLLLSPRSKAGRGHALALCLDPNSLPHGVCSTLNFSECPNADVASSLSDILETGSLPRKYFLSPVAAAGIIRRAKTRGKDLPPQLMKALQDVVDSAPKPPTEEEIAAEEKEEETEE